MESNGSHLLVRMHSILCCKCYALYGCSFLFMGFLDFARNDTGRVSEKAEGKLPADADPPNGFQPIKMFVN